MATESLTLDDLQRIDFAKQGGLVPQVAQDARTGEVLMLGYSNAEAVERSLETGELWFWSRSRNALWKKGETSGYTLRVLSLHSDCDADALLALVIPTGPTCHTGTWSCFEAPPTLARLERVLADRAEAAAETTRSATSRTTAPASYTVRLLQNENLRLKKLGEEAVELALACTAGDSERATEEAADLIYHALVACQAVGIGVERVLETLAGRLPGAK
ncbi:MAG: bifunctional phosphoribosyl-AMP cyclohydrolase/phosphoribosyl-ATP diphosphatase HisIE [Trueperaceae bacterium]